MRVLTTSLITLSLVLGLSACNKEPSAEELTQAEIEFRNEKNKEWEATGHQRGSGTTVASQ